MWRAGDGQRLGQLQHPVLPVALIFIIFEVEIAFLFPVASVFRRWVEGEWGVFALIEILIFVGILFSGWFTPGSREIWIG